MQGVYGDMKKYHGFDKAKLYLKAQLEVIKLIINIIKTNDIKCDLKCVDSTRFYKNYQQSISDFKELFKTDVEYFWMNQDVMSLDKLPFIGKVKDNLYISIAYNTWGMTNGVIGAKVIYDLVVKGSSQYQIIFNPKRKSLYLYINSILGAFEYLKVYIQSLFQKNNHYYIKKKEIIYGVYDDEKNQKHKIKLICPHMKYNLVFNRQEKTQD